MAYRKRRTYKKRTTRKGGYQRSDNDAMKQIGFMKYPHTKLTMNPKIPDGAGILTSGQRYSAHLDVRFRSEQMFIFLYPGLTTYCAVYTSTNGSPSALAPVFTMRSASADVVGSSASIHSQTTVLRWRMAGAGIRIRCVNNDDNNEGSFEAIRISTSADVLEHGIRRGTNPSAVTELIRRGNQSMANLSWPSQNSYISGTMKDIHKYYFMLKETAPSHDFVTVKQSYYITDGTILTGNSSYSGLNSSNAGLEESVQFVSDFMDSALDTIVIRLTGKFDDDLTKPATQVMIDGVAGIEQEFLPTSQFAPFMSECAYAPKALAAARDGLRRRLMRASN